VPGDNRTLQGFLPVRVHPWFGRPDQEERIRAEEGEPVFGRPQPGAGRHQRPDLGLGPPVAGLLGQFPDRGGFHALPAVHPAARREPDLTARIGRAEQQHPVGRVEHDQPGGRPEPGHITTVAPAFYPNAPGSRPPEMREN